MLECVEFILQNRILFQHGKRFEGAHILCTLSENSFPFKVDK